MQVDHYQAARLLTKAYASIAMFVFAAVAFQFFSGETLGIVRSMEDEPQEFWIVLGVQIAVFVAVVTLLYFHTRYELEMHPAGIRQPREGPLLEYPFFR